MASRSACSSRGKAGGQLEVGIGRIIVFPGMREPGLVEHATVVDALVNKVEVDAEIVGVGFGFGPQ